MALVGDLIFMNNKESIVRKAKIKEDSGAIR